MSNDWKIRPCQVLDNPEACVFAWCCYPWAYGLHLTQSGMGWQAIWKVRVGPLPRPVPALAPPPCAPALLPARPPRPAGAARPPPPKVPPPPPGLHSRRTSSASPPPP